MGNTTIAFTFVMLLNVFMWFSQVAMLDMNDGGTVYYNCEGTILENYGECSNHTITNSPGDDLPSSSSSVSPTQTNWFVDIFNTMLSWIKSVPGINYLYAIISAPYNLLKSIGLPGAVCFGLGALWYGITTVIIIGFITGRD